MSLECQHLNTRVFDSRVNEDGTRWRRRECKDCGERFNTLELPVEERMDDFIANHLGITKPVLLQLLRLIDSITGKNTAIRQFWRPTKKVN